MGVHSDQLPQDSRHGAERTKHKEASQRRTPYSSLSQPEKPQPTTRPPERIRGRRQCGAIGRWRHDPDAQPLVRIERAWRSQEAGGVRLRLRVLVRLSPSQGLGHLSLGRGGNKWASRTAREDRRVRLTKQYVGKAGLAARALAEVADVDALGPGRHTGASPTEPTPDSGTPTQGC